MFRSFNVCVRGEEGVASLWFKGEKMISCFPSYKLASEFFRGKQKAVMLR